MTAEKMAGDSPSPRIALITGATRGIGRAVAIALAKSGVHVIATGRSRKGLERLDDDIAEIGGSATLVEFELKDRPATMRLAKSLHKRWGRLDILIANAAIFGPVSPLAHIDDAAWDEVMDVNLSSAWRLIRVFDPLLRLSDAGRAIFVTSAAVPDGRAYWGATAASKAGVEMLAKTWALEVAETNLKVNILYPGNTATDMYAGVFPGADLTAMQQPEDVAPAFLKLASPDCVDNGKVFLARDLV